MRKKPITEKKFVKNLLGDDIEKNEYYHPIIYQWVDEGYSVCKIRRRLETLIDIVTLNDYENALNLYNEYFTDGINQKRKLEIRYGKDRVLEYEKKMKARPKPKKITSHFSQKYWIDKGYTKEEAIAAVTKVQSRNAKKRTSDSYKDHSKKIKFSLDYWTERGYTKEEAEILRKPFIDKCKNDLDSLIDRHGDDEGYKIYVKRINKYKESMKKNLPFKRVGGYVSKESLRFFIPLYKYCRKIGISRNEIYFGINGSREFFIRKPQIKNEGYFVDFCVPSLKIVVEYNGVFWHPKPGCEWKNTFISYDNAVFRDQSVKMLCERRGFDFIVVWSDECLEDQLKKIKKVIYDKKQQCT